MDFVCGKAAEAVNEALDGLQPARLKVATGEAQGKIAYNYYAPDLYDRRMSVIQAVGSEDQDDRHARQLRDPPRSARRQRRHPQPRPDRPALRPHRGAGRRHGPLHERRSRGHDHGRQPRPRPAQRPVRGYWNDSRTWDECLRIGHLMADEALRIVKDAPVQDRPTLVCDSIDVSFPVESKVIWDVVLGSPLKYPHNDDRSITARINLVNLGNAQILTIPGEALPNIGFYLKRKMRGEHNLLFGLTNDAFGYILTKVDFQSFPRYDYVSRTSLGEMTGEILIERSLRLVNDAPRPDKR